jgi:GNAT superfamily N-acetyltransferase
MSKVRRACLDDIEGVIELWRLLSRDQLRKDPYYKGSLDFNGGYEQFTDALTNEKCGIFVYEDQEEILGFIEVWLREPDFYFFCDSYAYILHLYSREEYRSGAIGLRLFNAAERWAAENSAKYLEADVFFHNPRVENALTRLGLSSYRKRLVKELPAARA